MALIVEDGTGLASADAYISLADANTYWTDRGNSTWDAAADADKEEAIRRATEYLDSTFEWVGVRVSQTQGLDWPRYDVIDKDGYGIDSDAIPNKLAQATARLAVNALSGDLLPVLDAGSVKSTRSKVGDLEKETVYQDGGAPRYQSYDFVTRMLRGLYVGKASNGGLSVVKMARG